MSAEASLLSPMYTYEMRQTPEQMHAMVWLPFAKAASNLSRCLASMSTE